MAIDDDRLSASRRRLVERLTQPPRRFDRPVLCVAWSGGLDSTVLLDVADRLRRRLDFELAAVHVNHGLREGSGRDAAFCRRVAAERGWPLEVETLELRESPSTEAHARYQRYGALAAAARRFGATHLATAHHADDAVGTALLNWTRGAGARGLASLASNRPGAGPLPDACGLELVRPFAATPREAIEQYGQSRDLTWRTDPTNADRTTARNRLRQDLLPVLRREAGSTEPLVRSLENLAADATFIEQRAGELIEERSPGESRTARHFSTAELARAADPVAAAALRCAARELPGPVRWKRAHLDRALDSVATAVEGGEPVRYALRGGVFVAGPDRSSLHSTHERGGAELEDRRAMAIPVSLERDDGTAAWSALSWFGSTVEWRVERHTEGDVPPTNPAVEWFDLADLPDELLVRGPEPGEAIEVFGISGSKSIRDLLRDGEVAERDRWRWPVLASPGRRSPEAALWVAGLRRSSRAPVDDSTAHRWVVRLRHPPQ